MGANQPHGYHCGMAAFANSADLRAERDLLARLVAFPSVSRESNAPIAGFLANRLEEAGCRVFRHAYDDGRKVNLLAIRGRSDADPPTTNAAQRGVAGGVRIGGGLLLSAHLDVVPAEEPDWTGDPFKLTERGGRFVGRGTADMKGFVALAACALAAQRDDALRRPLMLLLTADEEVGSLGAQAFLRDWRGEWPLPESVIVGEPTGLRIVRMHKGHLRAQVLVRGRPAHSGYPQLGVNAIERAAPMLAALAALAAEMREERTETSGHFPECPFPVLNLGVIHGGAAVNVVPDRCELLFGLRLLPGQGSEPYLERVRNALASPASPPPAGRNADARGRLQTGPTKNSEGRLQTGPIDPPALEVLNESPPMLCDPQSLVHRTLAALLEQSETLGVSFASDAGMLARAGLNCVLWGPGRIEDAHRADESLDIAQWAEARSWLDRFITRFCVQE